MIIMSNKDIFELNGPAHLKVFDWRNSCHVISVIASLVCGVKVMHHDLKKNRNGRKALGPPWWRTFGYEIHEIIYDESESFVFGAIYKLSSPSSSSHAPRWVVAFRGTIRKSLRDLKDDVRVLVNKLHETPRFKRAIEAVRGAVQELGRENVWIAGHSLGAAVAMLAAREMVKEKGIFMENTFLFNPPFPSPPEAKNSVFRGVMNLARAALALKLEDRSVFGALAPWRPRLFVNRKDWICSGYLRYFKYRGDGMIERVAMQYTLTGLLSHVVLGNEWREPMHRIPSAYVTENCNPVGIFKDDHGIHQWWNPNLQLETKEYNF